MPGLRANDAFIQADTLISEIDLLLRVRQTDALLTSVESLYVRRFGCSLFPIIETIFAPFYEISSMEISDAQKITLKSKR